MKISKFVLGLALGLMLASPAAAADPRDLFREATDSFHSHDFAKTIELCTEALAETETGRLRSGLLNLRGSAEMMVAKYPDAIVDFDGALDELTVQLKQEPNPDVQSLVVGIYWERGLAKTLSGRCPDALADFNTALQYDPKNVRVLTDRGRCYAKLNQKDAALADYNAAIALDPNDHDALQWRAELQ